MQTKSQKQRRLTSIKNFFDVVSKTRKPSRCERCASAMELCEAHFWVFGTGMKWKMSLPFCPVCEVETLKCLRRPQRIQ